MKRSGHHAFIHWLASGLESATHLNNAVDGWEERKWLCPRHSGGEITTYGRVSEAKENLIISVEDFDIDDWDRFQFEKFGTYRTAQEVVTVVFVRDFMNWAASCMKRRDSREGRDVYEALCANYTNDRKEQKVARVELWEKHLREFSDEKILKNAIAVSYGKWLTSNLYRTELAARFAVWPQDVSMSKVSKFGGGSSFDGLGLDGGARNMDVLKRYESFLGDPEYEDLIARNKINVKLSEQYLL